MNPSTQPEKQPRPPEWWVRLAWLPIPLLVVAIAALWVADLQIVWPLRPLHWLVHYGSAVLGITFIIIPAARNFLTAGQPSLLMLGCGMLMMDIGVLTVPIGFARSADTGFAIYNTSVLLGALCHFTGVAIASPRKIRLRSFATWLTAVYAGSVAVMGLVIWGAFTGRMPVFFIDGQGGTLLRSLVVSMAVALFLLTAVLLWQTNRRRASPFLFWYALGLVLLAAGLGGSMMIAVLDSPLQWVTRLTQVVGTVYMCVAVFAAARGNSAKENPLEEVAAAWCENALLAGLRQQSPLGWVMRRYGLAVATVAAAMGLRLALEAWVGPGLPPYITFYPAVMVVALLAGFGPGLISTVLAGYVVGVWIMPPTGIFSIVSPVDRMGLVVFAGMGLFMSAVADIYQRNRDKAAAYDRELALRESQEILRRQVEQIDPARAGIIAQEMLRVLRERGGARATTVEPIGETSKRVSVMTGAAVAGVGLLVLAGWALGPESLKSVLPGFPTMKSNTALCFLLTGVALALRERRAVRLACAGLVCAVAVLTLTEYITGGNFGLDQFLFRDIQDQHTIYPGRMVAATALGFLLSGASLLLLKARAKAALWASQSLAVGAAMIGMTAVLGYVYEVQSFYRFAGSASMALHTAASFVVLAAGLLFARTGGLGAVLLAPGPGAQLTRRLLPVVLLAPAVLGWLTMLGLQRGFYSEGMDIALLVLTMTVMLVAFLSWAAHVLNRGDVERRETETELRNLTEVINHAHEPLIVSELGGVIRAWNRGAEMLYGWPAADVLGRRKQTLLRTVDYPDEEADRLLESAGCWEGELIQITRDGRRLTIESRQTASRTSDGRVFILESNLDITERKRAEEELRRSEEGYRTLFNTMLEGFCVIEMVFDAEGRPIDFRFLEINPAFERQTGLHQAQGRLMREVVPDHEAYWFEIYGKVAVTGEPARFENEARALNRWYEVSAFRAGGPESRKVAILFNDITVRKKAAMALKEQAEQLENANKELESFSYSISHDLRAPLRAISGFTSMLLKSHQGKFDEDAKRKFLVINDNVRKMGELIDDLLAFSRSGRQAMSFSLLDMEALVKDVWQEQCASNPSRKMELRNGFLPETFGDRTLIRQVLINLLSNAVKFTKEKDIASIEVGGKSDGKENIYYVKDNGVGFDMKYYDKLFGVFQRLHSDSEYEGTGVGLAIVQQTITRHGGRVWGDGKENEGATFYFSLPLLNNHSK